MDPSVIRREVGSWQLKAVGLGGLRWRAQTGPAYHLLKDRGRRFRSLESCGGMR